MSISASGRRGITLMELLVVMSILVILAMLAVPMFGRATQNAELDATYQTMLALRDALMGSNGRPGFYQDMKNVQVTLPTAHPHSGFPEDPAGGAYQTTTNLLDLFVQPAPATTTGYDPITRRGWRGPYLSQTMGSLSNPSVNVFNVLDSFHFQGTNGMLPGRPIWLQFPTDTSDNNLRAKYVRLIYPGGKGANVATDLVASPSNLTYPLSPPFTDELILYLRRDLGVDWTSYWDLKKKLESSQ